MKEQQVQKVQEVQSPEYREHQAYNYTKERSGRSNCLIDCPFCGATVKAYVWSLAGGGKKCPCGALHCTRVTIAPKKKEKKATT